MLNVNVINAKNTQKVEVKPGQPANLKVDPNTRFELVDSASGKAPAQIKARRVGDNLEIVTDEKAQIEDEALSNAQKPDLVLENYYKQADVSLFAGAGEEAVSYVPVDGAASSSYAAMNTSATTGAALGVLPLLNPLLGAAVVGAGAVVATNGNDTGTSNQVPVAQDAATKVTENKVVSDKVPTATDADGTVASYRLVNDVAAGKLTFNADGSYSFEANKDFDRLADGQTKTVSFTYSAVDNAGGVSEPKTVTITVTGANDAPVASAATKSVDEGMKVEGSVSATDADAGAALKYALVGTAPAGLIFNADGAYTFDANNEAYNSLKAGETKDLMVKFKANDGTVDSAEQKLTITVKGVNDPATISGTAKGDVTEDAVSANVASGTLAVSDVDTGQALFEAPASLAGTYGTYTFDASSGAWTYTLDNTKGAVQALTASQNVVDHLVVKSLDGTASQSIDVTITGANDAATISGTATGAVTEDASTANATGTLTVTDADAGQAKVKAQSDVAGTFGKFSIKDTGEWTYTLDNNKANVQALNANEKVTETFTVKSADGTASQDVVVTITGVNDAPVASAATKSVDEGMKVEGSVFATDADAGAALKYVLVSTAPAGLSFKDDGTYSFDASDAAYDSLKSGELKDVVVKFKANDGTVHSAEQTLTITVKGTNDAPVATYVTAQTATEDGSVVRGQLTSNDIDKDAAATYAVDGAAIAGLTINADGRWTFDPTNAAYQSLVEGDSREVTVTYKVTDDQGASDTESFTITVTGTNDAPTISVQGGDKDTGSMNENDTQEIAGSLTLNDVDADGWTMHGVGVRIGESSTFDYSNQLSAEQQSLLSSKLLNLFTLNAVQNAQLNQNNNQQWSFKSENASDFDFLPVNKTLVVEYVVSVTDAHEATTTHIVSIAITGKNDAPVIQLTGNDLDQATLTESNKVLSASGTLTVTDPDDNDSIVSFEVIDVQLDPTVQSFLTIEQFASVQSALKSFLTLSAVGTMVDLHNLEWTFDSAYDNNLDLIPEGATLSLKYTIEVKDSAGTTTSHVVTVKIDGTNDGPAIQVQSGDTDRADLTETNSALSASGTVSLFDMDLTDEVNYVISDVALNTTVTSFLSADDFAIIKEQVKGFMTLEAIGYLNDGNNLQWTFDSTGDSHSGFIPAGQTLALDYTVTATDKSGEIATQVIHINILGTNAIPLIEFKGTDSAAESLIETDDVLSTTGTMSLTDLDFNDPANATRISVKVTGFDGGFDDTYFLGMLKLSTETYQNGDPLRVNEPHNVRWKFGSFAQDDFDYLVQDEVLELEYTIEVKDSLGATSQQAVAVSITGTNDAPQVFVWDGDSASGSILSPTQDVTGSLSIFDEDVVTAYFAGVKFDGVQITDTTLQSSLYSLLLIDPTSTYKTVNEPHNFDWRFNTTDAFAKGLTSGLSAGEHQLTYTMDFVDTYSAEHKQDINILFTV